MSDICIHVFIAARKGFFLKLQLHSYKSRWVAIIRWINIVGAQYNGTHGQRPQEWGTPQCKYYSSVKHNDPTVAKYPINSPSLL